MLTDILATLIAFVSIILLLSIVVTALVQTSQAVFRLRSRNLLKGLAAILVNARESGNSAKDESKKAKRDAAKILNAPNVALLERVKNPEAWQHYWILGPKVSWLDPEQLPVALKEEGIETGQRTGEELKKDFERGQEHLEKRFLRVARGWTFVWALILAVAFQVSAPELFGELTRDTERRDRIVADAENLLAHEAEGLGRLDYDQVAPEALEQIAARHAEHREQIEEAIGIGTTREFLLAELELALEEVPDRALIVEEYDQLLDQVAQQQLEEMSAELRATTEQLRHYDVELWPRGLRYYYDRSDGVQWDALVGVLITAILLSLGAPFWYEQLRDAILLRDVLAGREGMDRGSQTAKGSEVVDKAQRVVVEVRSAEAAAPPTGVAASPSRTTDAEGTNLSIDVGSPHRG